MISASPITVTHGQGSYPVYIEPGILGRLEVITREQLPGRRLALIADATVADLFTGDVSASALLTFPAGESSKTRETWARLSDELLAFGFGRDSGIIALGGGVTGDLAGFVAATYLRGVPYLQVPTTVLAMIDASVGGKTGVDTAHGKNLIGAFHPPAAVAADPETLRTLPGREYRAGLAEAVKHGLVADAGYLGWLGHHAEALASREPGTLTALVRRSVEIKAEIVSEDERETGRRAVLNAGHTVAHAVEHVSGYNVLHGEAVAMGLVAECALAERLGIAAPGVRDAVATVLSALGLPVRLPPLSHDALLSAMSTDKKNRAGTVRFALARAPGAMYASEQWTVAAPLAAIRDCLDEASS